MKYYKEDAYGHKAEISKTTYYALVKKVGHGQETVHTNNGKTIARSVIVKYGGQDYETD